MVQVKEISKQLTKLNSLCKCCSYTLEYRINNILNIILYTLHIETKCIIYVQCTRIIAQQRTIFPEMNENENKMAETFQQESLVAA